MDLGASAGFVAEPAEPGIISRKSGGREEKVLDRPVVARVLTKGTVLFAVVTGVYLSALYLGYPFVLVQTCALSAWIFGHIVLAYFSRSEERMVPGTGFFGNKVINLWGLAAIGTLLAGIYIPALHAPLNLGTLPPEVLVSIAIGVSVAIAIAEGVRRLLFRRIYPRTYQSRTDTVNAA